MKLAWVGASDEERSRSIACAAELICRGELVAYPTETVYGLGAHGLMAEAVEEVFKVKGRPRDKAILLAVTGVSMLEDLVQDIPDMALKLMSEFWPGPLSLILRRSATVPDVVTAGRPGVGVRCPDHPVALRLIHEVGAPVTSPSANLSGLPSCRTPGEVIEHLGGRIAAVLDAGPSGDSSESTVLDLTGPYPVLVRAGSVCMNELEGVVGPICSTAEGANAGSVVVVCTGNTCRSPVAERILARKLPGSIPVESAGVAAASGKEATDHAVRAAGEAGYDLSGHKSRDLEQVDWSMVAMVIAMTRDHADHVRRYLDAEGYGDICVFTLGELAGPGDEELAGDVPDPFGGSLRMYRQLVHRLEHMVEIASNRIVKHLGGEG